MVIDIEEKKNLLDALKVIDEMNGEQMKHLENVINMDNGAERMEYIRKLPEKDAVKVVGFFTILSEGTI